jgi:hypothetical protein
VTTDEPEELEPTGETRILEEASVTITLESEGKYVTLADLARTADDFAQLVTAVAGDLREEAPTSLYEAEHWAVSNMRVGSAVLTVAPLVPVVELPAARQIVRAIVGGLRQLEEGAEERPEHFPEAALAAAKHLVGMLNDGITRITVKTADEVIELSQRVQATVDAHVRGVDEVLGSVEGRLEGINVHTTRVASLYHSATGRRIECRFSQELLKEMIANFGERVQVMGLVRYTRRGEPANIQVEAIRRLRERGKGASIADLAGIDPGFTGGLGPDEYLEHLRNGG